MLLVTPPNFAPAGLGDLAGLGKLGWELNADAGMMSASGT